MITENSLYDIFLRHFLSKRYMKGPHRDAEWGFLRPVVPRSEFFMNCIFYPAEY